MNFEQHFDLTTDITTVMPFFKYAEQKIYLWAREQAKEGSVCVPSPKWLEGEIL